MKSLKKGMSIIIACSLMVTCVAGCGNKSSGEKTPTKAIENSNFNKTGLPIVKEKVTYTLMTSQRSSSKKSMDEKDIFKTFEKDTNVHIKWMEIPDTGFNDKMNITLNSGDLPDGVFAAAPNMADAVASKLVVAFDDYMEYAPNMKKMFKAVPEAKIASSSSIDGKIYKYPGVHPKEYATVGYPAFINKAWLDKLGLKMPTTTDEFKNVLQAFKDNDCNGNGDKNDEIPLATSQFWGGYWFQNLMASWDLLEFRSTNKYASCTVRNGKLDFNPVNPNYRKALEYFHDLYKRGLMEKDCMTLEDATRHARLKVDPPVAGVFFDWTIDMSINKPYLDQYVAMPPLKGPDGVRKYCPDYTFGITDGLVIFKGCKSPEILVRWIDYLNDGINPYRLYGGMEGEGWTIDKKTNQFVQGDKLSRGIDYQVNEGIQNPPGCRAEAYTGIKTKVEPGTMEDLKPKWAKVYEPYLFKENWPSVSPITPSDAESKEIGLLLTDLSADCQSFMVDAVTNGIDDNKWKSHISKCEQLEYKKVVAYWQKKYDASKNMIGK